MDTFVHAQIAHGHVRSILNEASNMRMDRIGQFESHENTTKIVV
jgi:hypothetical protein